MQLIYLQSRQLDLLACQVQLNHLLKYLRLFLNL
nr:MAG TPA: hypothetical protein [Caudoviricetes sp.]